MTRVKICGITSIEDAFLAIKAGADALGFVFAKSPRQITAAQATAIIKQLPPFVTKVGLFVNEEAAVIKQVVQQCRLDCIQLHGEETSEFCGHFKRPVIKAFRIVNEESLRVIDEYKVAAFLFDAYVAGVAGGTGKTFSWDLLEGTTFNAPVILAGGLTVENVEQAIKKVKPYAVDVSSGVEESHGVKDGELLTSFIKRVRKVQE